MTRLSPAASTTKHPARSAVPSLLTASLFEHSNRRMTGIDASASASAAALALAATAAFTAGAPGSPRMQRREDGSFSLGSILDQALSYAREERERNDEEGAESSREQ
jgi:hypothetical protein